MIATLVPYKIFPSKTGGQKGIALFSEHLAKRVPLLCITVKSNLPEGTDAYKVLNILSDNATRYINPFYFFRIRKILLKNKATHLITEHPYYGWLTVLLKWFTPVKLIIHSHNIESKRWKDLHKWWWRILFHYEKWVHRRANYNLFITDEDRQYAIEQFHLKSSLCMTATFGIAIKKAPAQEQLHASKVTLRSIHNISDDAVILLFNGIFSYPPNAEALSLLLNKINPLLIQSGLNYKLIICGRDIPDAFVTSTPKNCIIAGFVDDMNLYLQGADIFLNPIATGGGIKTKLVEALAYNLSCVSFDSGAIGVPLSLTGSKLHKVPDGDLIAFCKSIEIAIDTKNDIIPDQFFEHFNWDAIAGKVEKFINS